MTQRGRPWAELASPTVRLPRLALRPFSCAVSPRIARGLCVPSCLSSTRVSPDLPAASRARLTKDRAAALQQIQETKAGGRRRQLSTKVSDRPWCILFAVCAILCFLLTPPCLPLRQADPERPLYDENTKNDMQDCRVAALQQIQETKAGRGGK